MKLDCSDRYYRHGELEGNVLRIWRDHATEASAASSRHVAGECDVEIADYLMGVYLGAHRHGFKHHPELRHGVELCCENHEEARHMALVMAQFTQDTIPYTVTWHR
jgi:hypothetical protein